MNIEKNKLTLGDVVKWAIANTRDAVFKDYTHKQIEDTIVTAYNEHRLCVDSNNRNEIFGLVIYEKCIFINHIVTSHKFSMQNLFNTLKTKYPFHGCLGQYNGKIRKYRVDRSLKLMNKNL